MRHLVSANLVEPDNINQELATQIRADYMKNFDRHLKIWEIENSWVPTEPEDYSIKIRVHPGHFLIVNHQLVFSNQQWSIYIDCPYQVTKGLVDSIKTKRDWTGEVVHAIFECSDGGKDILTLTQGIKDYKIKNNPNPIPYGLWAWTKLGW